MTAIILRVELLAGSDIEDACKEIIALADRIQVIAIAKFNGVELMAVPGDDAQIMVQEWHKLMDKEGPHRIARGA